MRPDGHPIVLPRGTTRADLPELAARVRADVAGTQRAVVCDVGALDRPCLGTVDLLACLALIARRGGGELELRGVGEPLRALLRLAGLDDRLRPVWPSGGVRIER